MELRIGELASGKNFIAINFEVVDIIEVGSSLALPQKTKKLSKREDSVYF